MILVCQCGASWTAGGGWLQEAAEEYHSDAGHVWSVYL